MGGNTGNFRTSGTTSATNGTRTLASMLVSGNSASSYSRIAMFDKLHGKNVDNSGDTFWANTPSTSDGNAIFYDGNVVIGGNVSSRQTLSLLNSSTDVNEGGLYLSNGNINVDCYSVQTAKDAVVGELNFYNGFLQGSNSSSLLKTSVQCLVNETGSSATNLNFVLNGVQKMRLNSQGLNVNGSFNNVNGALNLASTVKTNADDVISTINFYNGTDNAAIRSSIKSCVVPTEDAPNNSDLRFFTQPDAIDQVERMRIASDGVVTINNDLILGKKLYINENGESISINGDQKIIAAYRGEIREFYIGQAFQNSRNLYIVNDMADGQIFINSGSDSRITMTSRGVFFNRITNNDNEIIGNIGATNTANNTFHINSQNNMYIQSGVNGTGSANMTLTSGTGEISLINSTLIRLTTPGVVSSGNLYITNSNAQVQLSSDTGKSTAGDILGEILFYNNVNNGNNVRSAIRSCVSVTNSGTPNNTDLRFFTQLNYTDHIERMRIDSDGTVRIFNNLNVTGTVSSSSSSRYKNNINNFENDTSVLHNFKPKTFKYNKDGENAVNSYGFIAEELYDIDPKLVLLNEEGQPESIYWDRINLYNVCEVQKLRKELDELKELMKSLSK